MKIFWKYINEFLFQAATFASEILKQTEFYKLENEEEVGIVEEEDGEGEGEEEREQRRKKQEKDLGSMHPCDI